MKIAALLWDNLFKTGGREVFSINLFDRLAAQGHDLTVYLPEREKRKRGELYASLPFKVRFMPFWQRIAWSHFPSALQKWLRREQKKHGYDVWQGMGAYPESYLLSEVETPCVIRMYGEDIQIHEGLQYGLRRDPGIRQRVREGMSAMDKVIAMTPSLARDACDAGAHPDTVQVIPNAIDFRRLQAERGRGLRERFNISDQALVLLTVGRNHLKKGFELIPQIGSELEISQWCWIVVGAGTESLQMEIDRRGLNGQIIPMPSIRSSDGDFRKGILSVPPQRLVDYFKESDLFVLPSRIEGYSRVIAEAMGAGLPVVTTDAPGCGEVFSDGAQGVVSPVDDVSAMAANINRLAADSGCRTKLSENAVALASELDWDRIVKRYTDAYQQLIR